LSSLKTRTVPELVRYMTNQGLTFTSAVPGDESAYLTLYQAMANFDTAMQALVGK
jgi:hypothetical protein